MSRPLSTSQLSLSITTLKLRNTKTKNSTNKNNQLTHFKPLACRSFTFSHTQPYTEHCADNIWRHCDMKTDYILTVTRWHLLLSQQRNSYTHPRILFLLFAKKKLKKLQTHQPRSWAASISTPFSFHEVKFTVKNNFYGRNCLKPTPPVLWSSAAPSLTKLFSPPPPGLYRTARRSSRGNSRSPFDAAPHIRQARAQSKHFLKGQPHLDASPIQLLWMGILINYYLTSLKGWTRVIFGEK